MPNVTRDITHIENWDPIAKFIKDKLHWGPIRFGLLIFGLNIVVDSYLGWRYNVWFAVPSIPNPGLLQDLTALTTDFILEPIVCGLYLWSTTGTSALFKSLFANKVLKSTELLINALKNSHTLYRSISIFFIVLTLSFALTVVQIAAYMGWVPWRTLSGYLYIYPEMSYVRAPFWFMVLYAVCFGVWNLGVTFFTLQRVFWDRDIVKFIPLHADGSGGLGSIGAYTMRTSFAIAPLGLMVSVSAITEFQNGTLLTAYPVLLIIVAYLVLAPIAFFGPLWIVHQAMQKARDRELNILAETFDKLFDDRLRELKKQDNTGNNTEHENIEEVIRLHTLVKEFPTWPYNFNDLRRFIAVVTTPLVPALLSLALDFIKNRVSIQFP